MGDYTEFGTLKYDQREIAQRGYGMAAAGPGDDGLLVVFYNKSVIDKYQSQIQGKRVNVSKQYIKVQHPGESLNVLDRPVQDADKLRWPRQWDRFLQGQQQIPDGVPITVLFPQNPEITDTLIGYNIHTVEQLAALSGHAIGSVGMGCQEWVNKAGKYLEHVNKGVNHHKFEAAMEEKDRQIATLTRQVEEMSRQINKVMKLQAEIPPTDFDVQSSQIALLKKEEIFNPPPQEFTSDIRPRRGRPPGSRNKAKE